MNETKCDQPVCENTTQDWEGDNWFQLNRGPSVTLLYCTLGCMIPHTVEMFLESNNDAR